MKTLRPLIKNLIPLLLIFIWTGCEDEQIEWETEDVAPMLVVEGSLSSEKKVHRLVLSTTADYFNNQPTPRVTGAEVVVTGASDTIRYSEEPDEKGLYTTVHPVAGKPGENYRLDIHLEDPIRQHTHYYASEKMTRGLKLDTINAILYENPFYAEESPVDSLILFLTAYGKEPKDIRNYYTLKLIRNNKALHDTIDEVEIYSDTEELEGEYIHHFFFLENFLPGDSVELKISTVSKAYRKYLTGLQNIVNQSGNPFDLSGPPANAIGNIKGGEALGFFKVSDVSRAATIVEDQRSQGRRKSIPQAKRE